MDNEGTGNWNYLPGAVIATAFGREALPDPDQYESFFPRNGARGKSYVEEKLRRRSIDKLELAAMAVPHITREAMEERFDLPWQLGQIIKSIQRWNA